MTGRGPATDFLRRIAELEQVLDGQLQDWREMGQLDLAFVETAALWSKAVWMAAGALGPAPLSPATLERGLALARRPVFVCGVHRSGTTLLRDLLDGHPALVILPSESNYYTGFERPLRGLARGVQAEFLCRKWLERIVNPNNQPPYWLLGRSGARQSAYVELAREFRAWAAILPDRAGAGARSWPLVAFALAYATRVGGGEIPPTAEMWVEKSPTNERYLERLWGEFPEAKVIHVLRRPDAVLSSYKAALGRVGRPARQAVGTLRDLARSYRIALDLSRRAAPERYRLLRYEQLVAQPAESIGAIAAFLGIDALPVLLTPTVAAVPATSNSSFERGRSDPAAGLTPIERDVLALTLGGRSARIGYAGIDPVSPPAKWLRRLLPAQRPLTTIT